MFEVSLFSIAIIAVFFTGYLLITLERWTEINKATIALMMGVLCWVLQSLMVGGTGSKENWHAFCEHISNISQVFIFLLCAMTIVEIISAHDGFDEITKSLTMNSKKKFLWTIGLFSFLLSSILDNLTTTIVMVAIIQKLVVNPKDRMLLGGGIVIAANAGGAWTPIGDVTTTMLWIGGQISTGKIISGLFLPSAACFAASFACLGTLLKGNLIKQAVDNNREKEPLRFIIFALGVAVLVFVPVFKLLTGLPPFMGVMFGLSVLWIVTDIAHRKKSHKEHLKVTSMLSKIDMASPLFFLGILLAVDALETAGILGKLAFVIDQNISSRTIIAAFIGLASAVIDNIPLVAAAMGMYDLSQYPTDSSFWQLIAYCAGTGGSILIIGSAAGVVYMGMEMVDFFTYLKYISIPALVGYFTGIGVYLLL